MKRIACTLALMALCGPIAAAQPAHAARRAHAATPPAVDRVPLQATTGKPGSANSPKPDANVPPSQTPSEPIGGVKR